MSLMGRVRTSRHLLSDEVRDRLLSGINSGELAIGDKIPNEQQLCDRFGVSRVTVREAVRSLVEAGYLTRIQGSGTYVAFRPSARHSLERNLSYTAMIRAAGMRPGRHVLRAVSKPPDRVEAERLQVPADADVVRVERVRSADGRPVIYSIDTLPAETLGKVEDEQLGGSLYELLSSLGHAVAHSEATLLPVLAGEHHARTLQVGVGSPLLHITQLDWTGGGQPAMFSLEWHVPGIFELSLLRRPN
jgi:DNA-binding GntR family transcriptional regulator